MSQQKCVDLNIVSGKFTKEVLTDILSKACNGAKEARLIDWNFDEGFVKGDYYTSNIKKGSVNGVIEGSQGRQHVRVNFVVKTMPKHLGRRKTMRSADFFRNEIAFYTEVASRFEKFLASKGQSDFLCIPRHLASLTDGENDFLVLEDVSCLGFGPASRQSLDWTECTVILKTMAKFHAISFAYKDQRKEEFAEITGYLEEMIFRRDLWPWYKKYLENLLRVARHALTTEYPDSKADKYFNSYKSSDLYDKCKELCSKKDAPTSIICEGDCWPPNFLVRDIGQNLKEALMLDFQLSRCVSPITDLSFFTYACTLKPFRDRHFDEMLKMYHSELSNAIRLLGSVPEDIYPWDLFMKEVKEQFIFGLVAVLEIIPLSLIETPPTDLDSMFKTNEAVDITEVVEFFNIETASGRQRLADVIVHAVDNGFMLHAQNIETS